MAFKNNKITIFIIVLAIAIISGAMVFYSPEENTYENKEFGIYFNYPDSWEVNEDILIRKSDDYSNYWVHLAGPNGEVSFNITPHYEGGFVLDEEDQDQYFKTETIEGEDIWRFTEETILDKSADVPIDYFTSFYEDRFSFRFIFPKLDQVNNVGNVFDSGRDSIQNGSFDISISAGVDTSSSSTVSKGLESIDSIVSSLVLSEPKANSFEGFSISEAFHDIDNWKTYSNQEFGFSFKYPEEYGDFEESSRSSELLNIEATSSEAVLVYGRYNTYPDLRIKIESIEDYSFNNIYDGVYKYDAINDRCIIERHFDDTIREHPFSVSYNNWQGCSVGVADAGYSNRGYAIPYPEKDIVLEITQQSDQTSSRPYDLELSLETLEFE